MSDANKVAGNPMAELLAELETLAKALPGKDDQDDKDILEAAEAAKIAEGDDPDGDPDEDEDEDDIEPMGKSFKAVIDGEEKDVVDGTELVKSLISRMDSESGVMAKAMGQAVELIKTQGEMLKSQAESIALLKSDIARIGGTGAGRKSALNVYEKTGPADAAQIQQSVTPAQLMAKAESAMKTGAITGRDLAIADVCIRNNEPLDPGLLTRIMGNSQ